MSVNDDAALYGDGMYTYTKIARALADGCMKGHLCETVAIIHIVRAIEDRMIDAYIILSIFLDPESYS